MVQSILLVCNWIFIAWFLFIYLFSAGFKRPVVIFGPISDAVNEKLANDMPDDFVIASKWSLNPLSHAAKGGEAMLYLVCVYMSKTNCNILCACMLHCSAYFLSLLWCVIVSTVLFWFILQNQTNGFC